jgi:hypothetical protein
MSEELEVDNVDVEVVNNEEEVEEHEFTDAEVEAMEHGWNPNGVDGKKNLSAEEYMDRKPLYDDLKSQNKKIKRMQESIDALKQFNDTISERERSKLLNQLKAAKKAALENDDYNAVVEIDERIADAKVPNVQQQTPEIFSQWVSENSWYNTDNEMRQFADIIGTGYAENHPNTPLDQIYEHVGKEVRARFPEKFNTAPRAAKPSAVEGATKGRRASSKKYSAKDLPEQDRQIMKTLIRDGHMSEQEYLKKYFS